MYQVVPYEEFAALREAFTSLKSEVATLKAAQPEWIREDEAQSLTGLSRATLARERKKENTTIVFKTEGGLRYLRSTLLAFNESRSVQRSAFQDAA